MIDLAQLRREPDVVKAALARRGVPRSDVDELETLDSRAPPTPPERGAACAPR